MPIYSPAIPFPERRYVPGYKTSFAGSSESAEHYHRKLDQALESFTNLRQALHAHAPAAACRKPWKAAANGLFDK